MDDDRYAWVREPSKALDRTHPDYADLIEADDIERWIADGAPSPSGEVPAAPATVEIPPVALCLSRDEAAAALRISTDTFERHVLPNLRVAQVGRRQLVPVRELEAWLSSKAARALR
jgi:hypothetical protein